jgi:hypothetical protein
LKSKCIAAQALAACGSISPDISTAKEAFVGQPFKGKGVL